MKGGNTEFLFGSVLGIGIGWVLFRRRHHHKPPSSGELTAVQEARVGRIIENLNSIEKEK